VPQIPSTETPHPRSRRSDDVPHPPAKRRTPDRSTIADKDPYVRKTAAVGVSKLFDMIPETVETSGMLDDLVSLLRDDNPMVVANSIAAIFEINCRRTAPIFVITARTVSPILSAIVSCSDGAKQFCTTVWPNTNRAAWRMPTS
jgi:hypothetical protein